MYNNKQYFLFENPEVLIDTEHSLNYIIKSIWFLIINENSKKLN